MVDQSCLFNASFEDIGWVFDDRHQKKPIAVILVFLSVGGVCGNTWTILHVLLSKELKTSAHAFVVSLAVADLLIALNIPFYVQNLLFTGHELPLPCWLCKLVGIVSVSVCSATMINISVIALNRFVRITRPLALYYRFFNKRTIPIILAFPWICGVLVPVMFWFFNMMAFGFNHKYMICLVHFPSQKITLPSFLRFALIDVLFITVTIVCYVKLFLYSHQSKKKLLSFFRMVSFRITSAKRCTKINQSLSTGHKSSAESAGKYTLREKRISPSCENVAQLDTAEIKRPDKLISTQEDVCQIDDNFQACPTLSETDVKNFHQDVHMSQTRVESSKDAKYTGQRGNEVLIKSLNRREKNLTKNIFLVTCSILLCTIPYAACLAIDELERVFPYVTVFYISKCCINPLIYPLRDPRFRVCPCKRKKYVAAIF
ncbi:G-protein coupled receptor moody [Holothuria leucospilota]|uniref:G-protein coupled receptor moody n=1 Tax=Holothuria leucospilota TaxID=206669 RepID=A0A9Q0YLC9_HOLLE|nr:G-protein coupled receptor moody [Holothuria leucospilota]